MRTWSRDETLVEFVSYENEPLSGLGAGIEKKISQSTKKMFRI